jgi:hypothetical protein
LTEGGKRNGLESVELGIGAANGCCQPVPIPRLGLRLPIVPAQVIRRRDN